jgi:hypothetical protein
MFFPGWGDRAAKSTTWLRAGAGRQSAHRLTSNSHLFAMNYSNCILMRRLLAQGEGTSTEDQRLMQTGMGWYIAIGIISWLIVCSAPQGNQELSRPGILWQSSTHSTTVTISSRGTHSPAAYSPGIDMPRLRGTPRRGAAWHAAKSRRKRKEAFEKALAIATRRRRLRGMAIVEEEIPAEGLPSPPAYAWFTVPENWNPHSSFGMASTSGVAREQDTPGSDGHEAPYTPCFVEEEAPPEPTCNDQSSHAATGPTQPPSPCMDHLSLLFDVRNLLEDQVFRIERLEQRIDMFFAAHSRATPKKQCPTCARAYAFPARWRHTEAAEALLGSEVT